MRRLSLSLAVLLPLLLATTAIGSAEEAFHRHGAEAQPRVFVSPSGSDSGSCSRRAPCRSFARAYRVARPGQVVEVAGGVYAGQSIREDPQKTSPADVVFRPARGARVVVREEVHVAARHLTFRGMRFADGWHVFAGSSDVTFRTVRSKHLFIDSATNIRVIGGSIGPTVDYDPQIRPSRAGATPPRGIVLEGVFFHDMTLTPGSGAHVECLQVGEVEGLVIRRSRFHNCAHHSVFISPYWGGAERNILLENNFGGSVPSGYYGFRVAAGGPSERCENIVLRNNSALVAFNVDCGATARGVRLVGNVGPYEARLCDQRFRYSHNVWRGARCGPTDRNAPSGFRNPARFDLHLRAGAAALGRGDPRDFPARDIDGQRRPRGGRPDAGADER